MDIEEAYLLAKGFARTVYVRPPRNLRQSGQLWQLKAAAYGLTDSGRLWYLTSNDTLIKEYGLVRSRYDYSFYHGHDQYGHLDLALAIQVDDYVYCGSPERMAGFEGFLGRMFDVSKFARRNLNVMG